MTEGVEMLLRRLSRRARRVEPSARCDDCGFAHPLCLLELDGAVRCRNCLRSRSGGRPFDLHHIGGKRSALTVAVSPNLHVLLTFCQAYWREVLGYEPVSKEAMVLDLWLFRVIGPAVDPPPDA
jgi:hypothetical protein